LCQIPDIKIVNNKIYYAINQRQIPENIKVVTVCAAGRTNEIASDALRKKGIEALSLEGGMKVWSLAWNKAVIFLNDYKIIPMSNSFFSKKLYSDHQSGGFLEEGSPLRKTNQLSFLLYES
jgi:hypothetical protein